VRSFLSAENWLIAIPELLRTASAAVEFRLGHLRNHPSYGVTADRQKFCFQFLGRGEKDGQSSFGAISGPAAARFVGIERSVSQEGASSILE